MILLFEVRAKLLEMPPLGSTCRDRAGHLPSDLCFVPQISQVRVLCFKMWAHCLCGRILGARGQQLPVVPAGLVCVSFCNVSSSISSGPWINDSITSMNPSHHHHRPRAALQASQPTHGPPLPLFSWGFMLKPCQATPRNYTFIIIPTAACHLISPHSMFLTNASIPA